MQPSPGPPRSPRPTGLLVVIAIVAVAAVGVAGLLVVRSQSDDSDGGAGEVLIDGGAGEADPFAEPAGDLRTIAPISAVASNERPPVNLRCTGAAVDYVAENLVDGDLSTGWGASTTDGTGETIVIDLGEEVALRSIGMVPGFRRIGPRSDRDCNDVDAFEFNRTVTSVSYAFDNGSEVTQNFARDRDMQFIEVQTTTRFVLITVRGTDRAEGADDDTIISEVRFSAE